MSFHLSKAQLLYKDRHSISQKTGRSSKLKPDVNISGIKTFLTGFPNDYKFEDYLKDPIKLPSGEALTKLPGQTCYMSFGQGPT